MSDHFKKVAAKLDTMVKEFAEKAAQAEKATDEAAESATPIPVTTDSGAAAGPPRDQRLSVSTDATHDMTPVMTTLGAGSSTPTSEAPFDLEAQVEATQEMLEMYESFPRGGGCRGQVIK